MLPKDKNLESNIIIKTTPTVLAVFFISIPFLPFSLTNTV